ncbi:hypothetical protein DXG01_004646 [Tephrocybe rancida]|nr:hypothetical protein DXG01_004646 [Tephrocybe rancida]
MSQDPISSPPQYRATIVLRTLQATAELELYLGPLQSTATSHSTDHDAFVKLDIMMLFIQVIVRT